MKIAIVMALCAILIGCEFTVPLVEEPTTKITPALLGLWQHSKEDGKVEKLLILPLGESEYLVSWPAGVEDALFARACLTETGDIPLAQLKWFGTAEGTLSDDERVYQIATYAVDDQQLTIRMLNADLVGRDASSSEALKAAIIRNTAAADLFRESMVFRKVQH
ncbi:MAG: hypothetical protein KDN22_24560 [Verrucomicrobiae bacterium]|nr:hypothetical protein [Verrucomicrobiae bacterium]